MVAKPEDSVNEVWDGVEHGANTKIRRVHNCLQAYDLLFKCTAGKSVVCLRGNYVVNSYSGTKSILDW